MAVVSSAFENLMNAQSNIKSQSRVPNLINVLLEAIQASRFEEVAFAAQELRLSDLSLQDASMTNIKSIRDLTVSIRVELSGIMKGRHSKSTATTLKAILDRLDESKPIDRSIGIIPSI